MIQPYGPKVEQCAPRTCSPRRYRSLAWTNDDDVYLDAETARLLGVGDEAVTVHIGVVRAHYHASDYVEMLAAVAVAIAEARWRRP